MSKRGRELLRQGSISHVCVDACVDEGETLPRTRRSQNCLIGCAQRVKEQVKEERETFFFVDGRYVRLEELEHAPTCMPTGDYRNNEHLLTCRGSMARSTASEPRTRNEP